MNNVRVACERVTLLDKFGFIGERGNGLRRLRTFLKKGSKNSKSFEKALINKIII